MDRRQDSSQLLTSLQTRAVREVGAICAAQAAASLSGLVKAPIEVGSPDLLAIDLEGAWDLFGGAEAPALGVLVPFAGDVEGNTLLVFPEEGAAELEGMLFAGRPPASAKLRLSAFAEVGNILAGAFVSVLSRLTSRVLLNLPPAVVQDMAGALLDELVAGQHQAPGGVSALVYPLSRPSGGRIVRAVILLDPVTVDLLLDAAGRIELPR